MRSWKKIEVRNFPADFCSRNFWGWVSRYVATSLIVALYPGRVSDIIRFRPWSSIATGNHLDGGKRKKSKSCSDDWHLTRF
jgi:hypothetical protein